MSIDILSLSTNIARVTSQLLSSKLLTDEQIRSLSKNIVGQYFSDWFATPAQERETGDKVALAQRHIADASHIISGIRADLDAQAKHLNQLLTEIAAKKKDAEHYAALAHTGEEAFASFRAEMERAVREQLVAQANKDRLLRQIISSIFWLITLVAGAALGTYFPQIVSAFRTWLHI
jgi:hypothetical protein